MTKNNQSVSVIFPAYNEQDNIGRTIEQASLVLPELTHDWEIIAVNDGSTDKTAEILKECKKSNLNLRIIDHQTNMGYGAALRSGISNAKKELIFFCDSDLQFDIGELSKLLQWIGEFDIVIGYREKRVDPFHRRLNAFGWNILVGLLLGLKVKDIDCAFKVFKQNVFDKVQIDAVGAMVNTDILAQAFKFGFRIKEVSVTHYPRTNGEQSGANIKVILKAFKELIRLYRKLKEMRRHPRVNVPIKLRVKDHSSGWAEQTINLSQGGMRFKTDKTYKLKDIVSVEMLHDGCGYMIVSGKVVWVDNNEVALRFTSLDRNHVKTINNVVSIHV